MENTEHAKMPLIGDEAPSFTAATTRGEINFPDDYSGKWVILFSHPADFTPVCTSELMSFAAMAEEFEALNAELVGVSVDSISSHLAWLKTMEDKIEFNGIKSPKMDFPVVADVSMDVAKRYGMIQPGASDTKTVRSVFFIDPQGKIRAIIYYPLSNGRNFQEIKRILTAMQVSDAFGVATPADWQPGDKVVLSAPSNMEDLKHRDEKLPEGAVCEDWFFCLQDLDEKKIEKKIYGR